MFERGRWLIPVEKLALQGFPVDSLCLEGLSPRAIESLAGNAMSVPVVGMFIALLLAEADFPPL